MSEILFWHYISSMKLLVSQVKGVINSVILNYENNIWHINANPTMYTYDNHKVEYSR